MSFRWLGISGVLLGRRLVRMGVRVSGCRPRLGGRCCLRHRRRDSGFVRGGAWCWLLGRGSE